MKRFLQSIFSIKNIDTHKQITILGIKIKIKYNKRKTLPQRVGELESEVKLLRSIVQGQ